MSDFFLLFRLVVYFFISALVLYVAVLWALPAEDRRRLVPSLPVVAARDAPPAKPAETGVPAKQDAPVIAIDRGTVEKQKPTPQEARRSRSQQAEVAVARSNESLETLRIVPTLDLVVDLNSTSVDLERRIIRMHPEGFLEIFTDGRYEVLSLDVPAESLNLAKWSAIAAEDLERFSQIRFGNRILRHQWVLQILGADDIYCSVSDNRTLLVRDWSQVLASGIIPAPNPGGVPFQLPDGSERTLEEWTRAASAKLLEHLDDMRK